MIPVIFLHIPRTGGMSFRKIMDQVYGSENIGRCWWGDHQGQAVSDDDRSKLAYYGHYKFGLHRLLRNGRDLKYITIVREPTSRLISEYLRNDYRTKFGWTPAQFAKNVSRAYGWDNYGDNLMTRMLSGAERGEKITPLHLYRALENIKHHFTFVGFTSQYSRLVTYVRESLGWSFKLVPHDNSGPGGSISPAELEVLRNCDQLKYDQRLYTILSEEWQ